MSPTDVEVLEFIKEFIAGHEYPPSVRQIMDGMGWSSPATAHAYIRRLVDQGKLKRGPAHSPRALVVVKDAA